MVNCGATIPSNGSLPRPWQELSRTAMRSPPRWLGWLLLGFLFSSSASGEIHLRWNQAGYSPDRAKVLVALSETDLAGRPWRIVMLPASAEPPASPAILLEGRVAASVGGRGAHTPFPFNHAIDFSALRIVGAARFELEGAAPVTVRIALDPYRELRELPLRHLKLMRSGSDDVAPRKFSHPGDARAIVHVPDGDPALGKWRPASPARTVDALGGWYDAGDQIKFTLTIAYTTYHLLFAYDLQPPAHLPAPADGTLPPILDEARHGLEYLLRMHPDPDTFIVQVGNALDHDQGDRLPENDALDGKRPALCALSRVHLGSAAAALARGARIFGQLGRDADARRYRTAAGAYFARALKPDTVASAFERDTTNDFYHDESDADQLALAAAELFHLTHDRAYLDHAQRLLPPAGQEAGWADWHWLAHTALAPHTGDARDRLRAEAKQYLDHGAKPGAPWGIPGRYVWGSAARWVGAANVVASDALLSGRSPESVGSVTDVIDYLFGRNNWGVSFLFTERLPNSVRHIYSPAYRLLGKFPDGAFSEGPGDRAMHGKLQRYFQTPPDDPFHRFNTDAGVFFDHANDFMCQEATIGGQTDLLVLLTYATFRLPPPLPADRRGTAPIATLFRP